jgi:nucleoside phosphorylase
MIDILIIEDDNQKVQKICQVLLSVDGVSEERIEHVVDAVRGKRRLRDKFFDLLILDIAIPGRIDEEVRLHGGLELLREIIKRDQYKVPSHIIGVTKYPDIFKQVKDEFAKDVLAILFYQPNSDEFANQLRSKAGIILASKLRASSGVVSYGSHMSIICAMESPELESVLDNGWKWEQMKLGNDETTYYQARLEQADRVRIVHAAACPRTGMPASAILSTKMITSFRPQYLAMCGITAGYSDCTRLGDVIVADPVWDWGSGKWIEKSGELVFLPEPHQLPLDAGIRNKFQVMAKDAACLFEIRKSWKAGSPEHDLSVHVGPLASGASVLGDGKIRENIKSQHRKLMGIEMESYAVYSAAYEGPKPKPIAFSAKAVVDFADGRKSNAYHRYAAYVSAQVVKHFVEKYL